MYVYTYNPYLYTYNHQTPTMKQIATRQTNLHTGETIDGVLVWQYPKQKNGFQKGEFFMLSQAEDRMDALMNSGLTVEGFRVLFALLKRLDFQNLIVASPTKIGEELNMKPQNVSKAIAKLVAIEVILKGPKVGQSQTYRLNPSYGWKGKPLSHKQALQERASAKGWTVLEGGTPETT